jgi:hypothetical protein
MKQDVPLTESIFNETSKRICNQSTTDTTDAAAYLEALLLIVRNSELACVLRNIPDTLTERCESIKSALANSSLDRQAESLRTVVQLLIGNMHD